MTSIISSINEVLGALLIVAAFSFVIYSIRTSDRIHVTKVFAILFLVALALFANYWLVYFAAIFIVATAVTELEFLQNLAAIIRGNQAYFNYKKQYLSYAEATEKAEKEAKPSAEQAEISTGAIQDREQPSLAPRSSWYVAEQLALTRLEQRRFHSPIARGLRYSRDNISVEFDGVVSNSGPDKVIEVRVAPNAKSIDKIADLLPELGRRVQLYEEITERDAELYLVVVVPKPELEQTARQRILGRLSGSMYLHTLSYLNLGLED